MTRVTIKTVQTQASPNPAKDITNYKLIDDIIVARVIIIPYLQSGYPSPSSIIIPLLNVPSQSVHFVPFTLPPKNSGLFPRAAYAAKKRTPGDCPVFNCQKRPESCISSTSLSSRSPHPTMSASLEEPAPPPGQGPADPQEDTPISENRIWVDGCFDFSHHGEKSIPSLQRGDRLVL